MPGHCVSLIWPLKQAEDFVPDNWLAVGKAITEDLDRTGIQQKELAEATQISTATLREIQYGVRRRRNPRILQNISVELGHPQNYFGDMLRGELAHEPQDEPPAPADGQEGFLERLLVVLEHRLGPVVDVIYRSDSRVDVTIEIRHSTER